jgi:hypothetical protein
VGARRHAEAAEEEHLGAGLLDDSVRIASGISAGDRIVTAGANLLLAGQSVRLLDDPVPQAGGASR